MIIQQPLFEMSWRELRAFVRLGAHHRPDDLVVYEFDDDTGSPDALVIDGIPLYTLLEVEEK